MARQHTASPRRSAGASGHDHRIRHRAACRIRRSPAGGLFPALRAPCSRTPHGTGDARWQIRFPGRPESVVIGRRARIPAVPASGQAARGKCVRRWQTGKCIRPRLNGGNPFATSEPAKHADASRNPRARRAGCPDRPWNAGRISNNRRAGVAGAHAFLAEPGNARRAPGTRHATVLQHRQAEIPHAWIRFQRPEATQ